MDEEHLRAIIRQRWSVSVGAHTVREVVDYLLDPNAHGDPIRFRGRDLITGLPVAVEASRAELRSPPDQCQN